ncbi:MAG TPA: FAD-dependent monooxygenase, partial [Polyangia bacterium]|nr:FAD-dependent monooxygenase [Polyangia bacterium]
MIDALPAETRVLVVGGGPVGLTASLLLSAAGIPNVVVERRLETLRAPAAHVLRQRPMEVFERLGVAAAIRRAAPDLPVDFITWCATLGGPEIGRLDVRAELAGKDVWTNCPQNLLEPVLLEHARAEPSATVLHGVECTGLDQGDGRVRATIRASDGSERAIDAAWVIAADGAGSPTRHRLDIPMVGDGPQGRFFMVHFEADLRPWVEQRPGPLFWIMNPEAGGTLIVHEVERSHVFMTLRHGTDGEEEALPAKLAAALAVPVDCRILSVDAWSPHVQVAERYREGRVFLAGDAAHRFPPSGGLGLNTGILDVDTLTCLLAEVEAGRADATVLDRYERSCRPAAKANADASFGNLLRLSEISKVIGHCANLPALEARLASLDVTETKQLAEAIEMQRSHFVSDGEVPPD